MKLKKIIPHLWYDTQAREAAEFYVSVFPDSKIHRITTLNGTPSGTVEVVSFELSGNPFSAISAGPLFKFNESVSFMVYCDTQEEVDYYWEKLSAGGVAQACGWLKDRFGLSWQIIPEGMDEMMQTPDPERLARVTEAMLKMVKLDIGVLRRAYEGW
jgi:predicted 3-demethylubiquinone-9 3-methyltransferase (glyoxalase superfamily)